MIQDMGEKLMIKALAAGTLLAAIAVSASVAFSASTGTPFDIGTPIASETDIVVDRIGGAFASASNIAVAPAILAAAARALKGNLAFVLACANAVWPNIDAACLATADGRPAPRVRMITIGYQNDANTTVIVHIPVAAVAQR